MKAAAVLALIAAWLPWEAWLGAHFAAHMLRHMLLVAVAAPLLVLAWPGLGRMLAVPPVLGAALEFVLVWAWHMPAAHGLAFQGGAMFLAEQATFLLAGLLVWGGCLDRRGDAPGRALAGAGGLLLTSMHMTFLGALLVLAPRDLYADWCGTVPSLSGQQAGGMIMLALGTPIYMLGGLWLVAGVLNSREETA